MSEGDFKHESMQDCETIVKYLSALGDGFENARLVLNSEEGAIILEPRGLLKVNVKARKKGERVKLSIKLSWREPEDDSTSRTPLRIDSSR